MKKIGAKQIDVDDLAAALPNNGGGSTGVTFDSYSLENGNLIVTQTSQLVTSQVITNGELIITVA